MAVSRASSWRPAVRGEGGAREERGEVDGQFAKGLFPSKVGKDTYDSN